MVTSAWKLLPTVAFFSASQPASLVLSNNDGWTVAMIRAQYESLSAANHSVVLSAPARDCSGTGSSTAEPAPLTEPCEYNSCSAGSPGIGRNESDIRLNYINAYSADSTRYGAQTLAPQFFGGPPDLVVAGPNVGLNVGTTVNISGTVGAAVEAARSGLPAIAFSGSGSSIAQVSYTTLDNGSLSTTIAARIYAAATTRFVAALLSGDGSAPLVPPGTIVNVNYPETTDECTSEEAFEFVFARLLADDSADPSECGEDTLPTEGEVLNSEGCFASVSVVNTTNKADVGVETQGLALQRLSNILTCLPT